MARRSEYNIDVPMSYCIYFINARSVFKSFSLCLCGVALWKVYNNGTLLKFQSCYNKCVKLFFFINAVTV